MKFLVFNVLTAVAVARPDIGIGYNYGLPSSYGVPTSAVEGLSGNGNVKSDLFVTSTPAPSIAITQNPPSSFEVPIFGNAQFQASSFGNRGGFGEGFGGGLNIGIPAGIGIQGGGANFGFPPVINPEIILNSGAVGNIALDHQQREVQKHVYFFTAPEETEVPRQRVRLPTTPPQKHYKIIFIKAPTFATTPPIEIPAPQQNEEKTLVYVLIKKPEEPGEIKVAVPSPTAPAKPEVFFIKYRTQQEAEEAIANLHQGASINSNSLEGEGAFASSIARDASNSGGLGGLLSGSIGGGAIGGVFGIPTTTISPIGLQGTTFSPLGNAFGLQSSTVSPIGIAGLPLGSNGGFGFQGGALPDISGLPLSPGVGAGFGTTTISPFTGGVQYNSAPITSAPIDLRFSTSTVGPLIGVTSTTPAPIVGDNLGGGSLSFTSGGSNAAISGNGGSLESVTDGGKFASGVSYSGISSSNSGVITPHSEYGVPEKK